MRRILVMAAMFLAAKENAWGQAAGKASNANATALTVIRAGSLIDGTSDEARKSQLIFIRGERIEKVVDAGAARRLSCLD